MCKVLRGSAVSALRASGLSALAFVLATLPAWAQPQPEPLFADAAPVANRPADPSLVRSRTVSVRLTALDAARSSGPGAFLELNLFSDVAFIAVLDRIDSTAGGYVWAGHVSGADLSTVTLAVQGSVLYGSIVTQGATYLVKPVGSAGNGAHTIDEIDQSRFPIDAPPLHVDLPDAARDTSADPGSPGDDGSIIDVMVVYTPAAVTAVGGAAAMTALVNNAVSATNTAYANAGIIQRLRLAYAGQVSYSETGGATGISTDLTNLTTGVGGLSVVAGLRDTYHADVVSLLTNTPGSSYCGIGYVMTTVSTSFAPWAFDVVEQSCAVANLSFPHELGHNMGLQHDWFVDDSLVPYPYAHGHVNTTARWRTIMSYNDLCAAQGFNCSRLTYFSNPSLTYLGNPLGVPAGTSTSCVTGSLSANTCDADNRTALNNTRTTVANFRLGSAISGMTLSQYPPGQVTLGTSVTFTANVAGGTPPFTFRFLVFNGSTWSVGQEWSVSNTFVWTPAALGVYQIQAWARNAGSSATYDAYAAAGGISVLPPAPAPLSVIGVTPGAATVTAGSPLTWTAAATGGTPPYTYKFLVYDGVAWTVGQDWSASTSWTWIPPRAGTYYFQVWVRNAGSTAAYDAWAPFGPFPARVPGGLTITDLTASPALPAPAGTPITWNAGAAFGSGPYTFKFWVYDGSMWSVGQDWSASSTWTWVPPSAGSYSFQVWARNGGSVAAYDAWRGAGPVSVSSPAGLTVTALSNDRGASAPAGTPVRWSASAVGGTGPYTYRFWVYNGSTWSIGQDWSASNTWQWIPPSAGTYSFQVWVRNVGSAATYDAWLGSAFVATAPAPLAAAGLTMSPASPVFVGGPVVLTAAATGGSGPYTYKFFVFNGSTWSVAQDWSASNTATWTPPAAGTYQVQVWIRNAGSATVWDAWSGLGPVTVSP